MEARTLLWVGSFTYTLTGCLTLVSALLGQRSRILLWYAIACLLGGLAYMIGLLPGPRYWGLLSIWFSNIALITAYACLWTSFRAFAGKAPVWPGLYVGGVIWVCLCLWPVFMGSTYFRIVVFSALAIVYAVLCCWSLMPNLREDRGVTLFLLAILVVHGLFYIARMMPWPDNGPTWLARPDFAVTVLENMLAINCLAYGILILVNNRAMRRYQGALDARRHLLGRISHDLRSPLAAMLDSARLWRAGDTRRDYPRLIERHAGRQMELIDKLLEFSGSELAAAEVDPIPDYLYAFLDEVAETTELATERHGNRLHRHFATDLPPVVIADFCSLHRVLTNLLGNADKYTRGSDIHFTVERLTTAEPGSARLHFIVDDNGPGMPAEERRRMLQPFIRGRGVTGIEGSGLGLAIVTTLLERMNGHLEMGDSPTGGSRFHFELVLPLAGESDLEPLLEDGSSTDINGSGYTILVVDDDQQQRETTSDLLNGYGFDTLVAADGQAALDRLRQQPVDLILTDQSMAGLDGWRLLQAVRKRQPGLPIILYSALPPLRPARLDGATAFDATVLKPAVGASLLQRIALLLGEPTATA
ncbi:MAG: hybrid sensor histidine kinase/response regulator [Nevskiaceae bacterium]|nr:MAG: hybrid sensor histidine kinase/response regulator [Nevskiaceae bacterium]TBR74703.1 MAG: hybrid sensor histidine kinase/response regulator [Nevskiaceae bacterium]